MKKVLVVFSLFVMLSFISCDNPTSGNGNGHDFPGLGSDLGGTWLVADTDRRIFVCANSNRIYQGAAAGGTTFISGLGVNGSIIYSSDGTFWGVISGGAVPTLTFFHQRQPGYKERGFNLVNF